MLEILEIEKYRDKYGVRFSGTLRNQFRFNINDKVFIMYGSKLIQCRIIGVELPLKDNADYLYKIELPRQIERLYDEDSVTLTCDEIFKTIEQAEDSAYKRLDGMYKLDKENLDRFFEQYK